MHDGRLHTAIANTWRTRSAVDISLQMFAIMTLGTVLWLLYGIWLRDCPIIGANTVSLALTSAILVLKLCHG
jgi:MtN3 and saliva related transmembrane protein